MAVKFYTEAFMARRREWWKRNIWAAECQIASRPGEWIRGTIQERIVDNEHSKIIIKATFDSLLKESVDYVAVRLLDIAGNVAGIKTCNIHSGLLNNVMVTFTLPVYEWVDDTGSAFRAVRTVTNNTVTITAADLDTDTLVVYDENYRALTLNTDYTFTYSDDTLTISLVYSGYTSIIVFCDLVREEEVGE